MHNNNKSTLAAAFYPASFIVLGFSTRSRSTGLLLSIAVTVFLCVYVFACTPYNDFLYNDMLGYWNRAMERLSGNEFSESQFLAWPPGYHIVIAEIMRVFRSLGLPGLITPAAALFINVLLYGASVYFLHQIASAWLRTDWMVWSAVLLYGFGFPAWYFSAFLLAENMAVPLFVMAFSLVGRRLNTSSLVFAAGLFAMASFVRPSLAPFGLSFVLLMLVAQGFSKRFLVNAAVFSGVFFVLVLIGMGEVSRISQGKVQGLSANGGLDFFIANSRYHRIETRYDGWHNFVVVPALSWKPENGVYYSKTPYYHQDFYYREGWGFIKRDPTRLLKNAEHVRDLFFAKMLPSKSEAPGYSFFRPLWDALKFIMILWIALYIWHYSRLDKKDKPLVAFMLSALLITFLVSYLYTGEPRYTYAIIFIFYLLSFKLLEHLLYEKTPWRKPALQLAVVLLNVTLVPMAVAKLIEPNLPVTIEVRNKEAVSQQAFGELVFPYRESGPLRSRDHRAVIDKPGHLEFASRLQLKSDKPLDVIFDVASSWPADLFMDGKRIFSTGWMDYAVEVNPSLRITPGEHTFTLAVQYFGGRGGLTLHYNYFDENKQRQRFALGVSSERILFNNQDNNNEK